MRYEDLTGRRFGRLIAKEHVLDSPEHKGGGWICQCDCGNKCFTRTNSLKSGKTTSCGCYSRESASVNKRAMTHGLSKSRLYITWRNMRVRCSNKNDREYKHYGGRGIQVCIDRIDVDKDYSPDNCRFITRSENNKTRRKKERKQEK